MHIMSFLYGFMLLHDRKDISFQDCLPSTVTIYIKYFLLNPDLKSVYIGFSWYERGCFHHRPLL